MTFLSSPVTSQCQSLFERKKHICFGISPFNSYFSPEKIKELASWGHRNFQSFHFFVPDVPAAYTFEALGYSPEKAATKAKKQSQYLCNKIVKALVEEDYSEYDAYQKIIAWEDLSSNSRFHELSRQVLGCYENNPEFAKDCKEASSWVLDKKVPVGTVMTEEIIHSGVRYLLSETPMFLDAAGILQVEESVFCYHQCIPFIEKLFQRAYNCQPSSRQGFLVLNPVHGEDSIPANQHSIHSISL